MWEFKLAKWFVIGTVLMVATAAAPIMLIGALGLLFVFMFMGV